jgi:osmoprotectant transport system permease protein
MQSARRLKADRTTLASRVHHWCNLLCLALSAIVVSNNACLADELKVGSKRFTESYVLAEIVAQTARGAGETAVAHRPGLGNTAILFAALKSGAIDIYPEYSGTVVQELLGGKATASLESINASLQPLGLAAGVPLGFGNSYALAVSANSSNAALIRSISDMATARELRVGLSQEFLSRRDGWPALQKHYALPQLPRGLDHGLAYEVLASAQIDVMDVYTTDAKIGRYALRMLEDDRRFFPRYDALLLYRSDLPQRFPQSWRAIRALEQKISPEQMVALNAAVELEGQSFAAAAASFLTPDTTAVANRSASFFERLIGEDFVRLSVQHFVLVFLALVLSALAGVPLGIWAARSATAHAFIMPAVGVLQTVPALALLAILIALLGRIGTLPAVAALFL